MVASRAQANGKSPIHGYFQMYFGALEAFGQAYDPMLKGFARAQLELTGLMSRRAQAYMEIPSRLSQCRGPQDLVNEQMRFWRTAMEEYAESAGRIGGALASFALPHSGLGAQDEQSTHDYIKFSDPEPARGARERKAA